MGQNVVNDAIRSSQPLPDESPSYHSWSSFPHRETFNERTYGQRETCYQRIYDEGPLDLEALDATHPGLKTVIELRNFADHWIQLYRHIKRRIVLIQMGFTNEQITS